MQVVFACCSPVGKTLCNAHGAKTERVSCLAKLPTNPIANPRTGTKWIEIRDKFTAACKAAGLSGVWFHDLRRSFVTNTRRIGVPESVVMRMSGHKTRAVFDRYNVVEAEDLREAVRRIEAGQQLRQESVKVRKK